MGKVRTVCAYIALNARRNTVALSDDIAAICHIQHCTCIQNIAMNTIFKIQESQVEFFYFPYFQHGYIEEQHSL